ncbi:MAG: T9SS type A sorting domain-containing protein [Salibacteraceae bacterium]
MNKFYTVVVAFLIGTSSIAQNIDVACDTILFPSPGITLAQGTVPLQYVRTNYGDTLQMNDSVFMNIFIDNTYIGKVNRPASIFLPNNPDTGQISLNFATATIGSHQICVATSVFGKTDINPSNDTSCTTFNIAANDLAVDSMSVYSPMKSPGDTFSLTESLDSIYLTVRNNSSSLIFTNGIIPMTISINGVVSNINVDLGTNIIAPGNAVGLQIGGTLIPALPTTPGVFDICAFTNLTEDSDRSNDTLCQSYVIQTSPSTGIGVENFVKSEKVFYNNGNLHIELYNYQNQSLNLKVMDMTGKTVVNEQIEINNTALQSHSMDINELPNGAYILVSNSKTFKFIKQ